MILRLCSKSFKLGFSSTWAKNFQMYMLGFKKADKWEIKLPTFVESWRKQGSSRITSTSASLTIVKSLTVWITANWKILKEVGVADHITYLLRNMYVGQEVAVRILRGTTVQNWERSTSRLYITILFIYFTFRLHHVKCRAGWSTSWNQDCQEKY